MNLNHMQNIGIAVDAIIIDGGLAQSSTNIVLIQRKNEPFKGRWALPGGFVENGETLEKAVIREVKEETNLDAEIVKQLPIRSAPKRDPRMRVISVPYLLLVRNFSKLKAKDDAANAKVFPVVFSNVRLPKLAFDHAAIIKRWLTGGF